MMSLNVFDKIFDEICVTSYTQFEGDNPRMLKSRDGKILVVEYLRVHPVLFDLEISEEKQKIFFQ